MRGRREAKGGGWGLPRNRRGCGKGVEPDSAWGEGCLKGGQSGEGQGVGLNGDH